MKLKIKLPFVFLTMFVLIIVLSGIYMRAFVVGNSPLYAKYTNEIKEKYAEENERISREISILYPDLNEIEAYLREVSISQDVSIKLYSKDLSREIIAYTRTGIKSILGNYWVPIKTNNNSVSFFLEIYRYEGIKDSLLNLRYIGLLFPLIVVICLVFVILAVYFHFSITKPIQILNTGVRRVNLGRSRTNTLRSKKRDEIGELYNHFNEMEERLQQSHKEQIDMIAAIAHDLKTPLTTINGFVELMVIQRDLSEDEKQEYYELILKKSKHVTELINVFSEFTKGELELEMVDMKPVEALKLFENIAEEYETELSGLNYELIWKHSFNTKNVLIINENMIRRIFGNLFSNATRYGEKKDLKVYMTGYTHGSYAYFQVEDNGCGVPDKELSSLFLKFFTVDKSRQSQIGGMGLGLASCKSIVEHHDGEICAFHSEYGGLGIRFRLPLMR